MLCKGPGVATVNKNPEMSPFLLKTYSLVGEADTYRRKGNKLNNKSLKNLNGGPKERWKELVHSGQERPPQREALKLRAEDEGRQSWKYWREEGPEPKGPRQERAGRVCGAKRRQVWLQDSGREGRGHPGGPERPVGQVMPGSCMNVWILFREPWGPTGRIHPGIVWFCVLGRLLLLLSGDIPGGRGECQQEGLLGSHVGRSPDQRAWWPGETVMLERWWRKTPAPHPLLREPDCLRPVHSMQRETHCSPPTGGNGPEVA